MKRTTGSKGSVKDQTGIDEKYKGKKGLRKQINMQQLQLQKYLLRSLDQEERVKQQHTKERVKLK